MRNATGGLLLCVALLCANVSYGQSSSANFEQYTQLQKLLEKLETEAEEIPFNVQRIATQRLHYDSTRITEKGYQLIKYEIERVIREEGQAQMLSLEEFEPKKVLRVTGTDSTLSLRNTSHSGTESENSIRLLELSQKYSVDAFMQGYIQYENDLGYVVSLELISPSSREVIWSKSLVSETSETEEEYYKGKLTLLTIGSSVLPTNDYAISGISYSEDILLLDYSFNLALRQPINRNASGYIGVQAGYHYYNLMSLEEKLDTYEPFSTSVFEFGTQFFKTLGPKSEMENEYWLELFLGPNLLMPSNSQNLFSLTQGVNVNLSENLGVTLDFRYLFSSSPALEDEDEIKNIQLNTIGYGLKILLRI